MNKERGDFKWVNGEVKWVPSKKGEWVIHPMLGPMKAKSNLADAIISPSLAKEIDIELKKRIHD